MNKIKLKNFIGQSKITSNLNIYIKSCEKQGKQLDHILLNGSPGLGKTTLAHIIANEMKCKIHSIHAGNLRYQSDVLTVLTKIKERDILFLDEIHSLEPKIEEMFYSALESNYIDVILGRDISAKPIRLKLPSFTMIGATTKLGELSKPLIDRFGIKFSFNTYSEDEITKILLINSKKGEINISEDVCNTISKYSRHTPRIAKTLLNRIYDHALFENKSEITSKDIYRYVKKIGIYKYGLYNEEIIYLKALYNSKYALGVESIAMMIDRPIKTIINNIEPYLIQENLIIKTSKGRKITEKGSLIFSES